MAKIGSPLVPSERPSVQEPVFASTAGQISSNVARQKINLMDGGNLREAYVSKAELQGEMFNMVAARAEDWDNNRKLNEKKDQLAIEKEYSDLKIDHTQQFGSARTAQQKSDIRDSYTTGLGKLNKRVEGLGLTTLKDRSWAQKHAIDGRATGADFAIKSKHALYTETISNMNVKMATLEREAANKANVDPQRILNEGVSELEEMYELGAITKPQLAAKVKNFQHNVTLKRATLLATLHARAIRDDPSALPSMEELLSGLEGQLGMVLPEELREPVGKAFTNAYLSEIADGNRATLHAEKVADANYSIDRAETMREMKGHIRSGSANNEIFQKYHDEAIAMGDTKGARIIQEMQINWNSNTTPHPVITKYFTNEGSDGFQLIVGNKDDGTPSEFMDGIVINVDRAMEYIRNVPVGSKYDTNDEATFLEIEMRLEKYNNGIKNKEILTSNVLQYANMYLTNRINSGSGTNLENRRKFHDYFNIPEALKKQLEATGQQLTNTEWGNKMYENSKSYVALIKTVTGNIKRDVIKTRDDRGLYSNAGFNMDMNEWNALHGDDIQQRVAAIIDKTPYVPKQYAHTMVDTAKKIRTGNSNMPTIDDQDVINQATQAGLKSDDLTKYATSSKGTDTATVVSDVKKLKTQTLAEEAAEKNAAIPTMLLSTADFQDEANDELVDTFDKMGEKGKRFNESIGGHLMMKGAELTIKAVPAVASAAKTVVGFQGEQMTKAAKVAAKAIQDHGVNVLDTAAYWLVTGNDSKTFFSDMITMLEGVQDLTAKDMEAAKNSLQKNKKPKETPQPQAKGYDPSSAFTNENLGKVVEAVKEVVKSDDDLTNLIVGGGDPNLVDTDLIPRDADGMPSVSVPNMSDLPAKRPKPKPKPKPPHQRGVKTTKEWNPKTKKFE